ncbi:MAG: helix-turn-helix transcriptional regulator, partial [Elusimicrobia bacterium]|nr:helix-turn-helix transcriptional regulator [Elusimicrobiota bacterium]
MKTAKTFFAKQFRNIMIERNIRQQDLANKLNVGQTMISQWLTGTRNPNLNTIKRLASALNIPMQYFIEDTNTNKKIKSNNIEQKNALKIDALEKQSKIFISEISALKKEIKSLI